MKTPMLKRRLNPFLLASTVLVLSLLAGLAVTWQGQLSELVSEKKNLSTELEEKNSRIEKLEAEKSNLTEKSSTLAETVSQLKGLNSQLNATIKEKEAKIISLENIIDDKEQDIKDLNETNEELRDNLSAMEVAFLDTCSEEKDAGNFTETAETNCDEYFSDY